MIRGSNRFRMCGLCSVLVAAALTAAGARAITINLTFDSGASDSPAFDSAGANLTPIMRQAADFWEDIIEDSGTLEIEYYYDDLNDAKNTLGVHNNLATSGGKPTQGRIRFDTQRYGTARDWWFDPSPASHTEFNLQQALYGDLTGTQQSNWFSGSTPDLLEVGYRGSAVAGGSADGHQDIFSTAIHELGHALGLTGNVASGEVSDGDYDVPSAFVWGTNTNVLEHAPGNYHIASRVSLMCSGCGASSLRRMPTAADVFAAATASGWNNIDLPRQDFDNVGGSQDWENDANWEGNKEPGADDDAFVRNGGDARLSAGAHVENLAVDAGSRVFTGSHKLDVDDTATVGQGNGSAYISILASGGELEAATVVVNDGGYVSLLNGGLVDAGKVNIEEGGNIIGSGTVDASTGIKNNGTVTSLGTLVLTTAAALGMDLDGTTGGGKVLATLGDVTVNGELKDAFGGDIDVGTTLLGGRTLSFSHDWEMESSATLDLNGKSSSPAIVAGAGKASLSGDVIVDGLARFTADVTFLATVSLSIPDSNDELQLNGATTFNGGSFTGSGNLIVGAGATVDVESGAVLDVGVVNNGTLNLGLSPGIVDFGADYEQAASGILRIEIGGPENLLLQPPEFDVLHVAGRASLDGLLAVSLLDGYEPQVGDTFDVLTASSIVDAGLILDDPAAIFEWRLEAGGSVLQIVTVPEPTTLSLLILAAILAAVRWGRAGRFGRSKR